MMNKSGNERSGTVSAEFQTERCFLFSPVNFRDANFDRAMFGNLLAQHRSARHI